jgi:7-cyano-7-deazaguanine synthase
VLAGRSPLTNPDEKLEQYSDHDSMAAIIGDRVELTFVPMRNALFLTIAANRAAVIAGDGTCDVITGVCQADNANYPDCRQSFIDAQQGMVAQALGQPGMIDYVTPLMNMSKAESIKLALHLGDDAFAALAWSHTAYDGQYPPVGKDHATVLRAHGFEEAGEPDPLIVRAWLAGDLPALPSTTNYEIERPELVSCILADSRRLGETAVSPRRWERA